MKRDLRSDLKVVKLKEGTYLLDEFGGTNCYLVIGTEKALLIDCGTGFCDLRGAVEKITDLPIEVVATHAHVDHMGGRHQFDKIYVHHDDWTWKNKIQCSYLFRKVAVRFIFPVRKEGIKSRDVHYPKKKAKIMLIDEGYEFDLGNKIIKVKHLPGHSVGSIALVDETDKTVFSGDCVCDALWLQLPGATTVEEWMPSAKWIEKMSLTHDVFWGHRVPKLQTEYISLVISWAEEILRSRKGNSILPRIKRYPDQEDGIVYRTSRIFAKKTK